MKASSADPDFAIEVVDDLYRYRQKRTKVAWLLWSLTGIFGGHRFYLGDFLWGVAFLFTAGGGLFLWLWDAFQLRQLVSEHNEREAARQQAGLPPQSVEFLPPAAHLDLDARPAWAAKRATRMALVGATLLLGVIGFTMGVVSGATGVLEPLITMAVFMVTALVVARWPAMRRLPVLGQLSRWHHRLRLYYFSTDPGSIWWQAARPFVGIFVAPWHKPSRVEVRLYLQIGVAFAILFVALDLYELRDYGFWASFGLTLAELAQTVVYIYLFVAPVGAILLTQQLLARKDGVVVMMCLVTLAWVWVGLSLVGAI
ncbi:MAG: TM2 domain-containing protein [Pseudomonadota bacterium]